MAMKVKLPNSPKKTQLISPVLNKENSHGLIEHRFSQLWHAGAGVLVSQAAATAFIAEPSKRCRAVFAPKKTGKPVTHQIL